MTHVEFYIDFFGFLSSALACLTMSSMLPGAGEGLALTFAAFAFGAWALANMALGGELEELATGGAT